MRAKKRKPPANGRLSWDGRLWDPSGRQYERDVDELGSREAERLVCDRDVQVAISWCSQPLSWLPPGERDRCWRNDIAPNLHNDPDRHPPRRASDQLPFHAELWRSGDHVVVLFVEGP